MLDVQLGAVESRFADLIWQSAPLPSSELVKLAAQALSWKKSTTYTVLKRLCDKGLFENNGGTVSILVSKEDFYSLQSERFIDDTFHGSLPAFLAAFTARKSLSPAEIAQLREMVAQYEEG